MPCSAHAPSDHNTGPFFARPRPGLLLPPPARLPRAPPPALQTAKVKRRAIVATQSPFSCYLRATWTQSAEKKGNGDPGGRGGGTCVGADHRVCLVSSLYASEGQTSTRGVSN